MIKYSNTPQHKRKDLRRRIREGELLQLPGAYNALSAMLIEQSGFDGVYVSGAVVSNSLGLPDIGMTTLSEVVEFTEAIVNRTDIPTIVDLDTGFGETMNVVRAIQQMEGAGASGCHIEDQVNPKRCGHLDNKQVIGMKEMCQKINAASNARTDSDFLLIARTDAIAVEGFKSGVYRAEAYVDAGAEMIFPEALQDERDFEKFRKAIDVPLVANMTEFGKTKLLSRDQLKNLGYNMVIYPVTMQRLAMYAIRQALAVIKDEGDQSALIEKMLTRKELYQVLGYEAYNTFDDDIFNFNL